MKKLLIFTIAVFNIFTISAKEKKMPFYITYNKREKEAKKLLDNFALLGTEFDRHFLIKLIHQSNPCTPLKFKEFMQLCLDDDGTDKTIDNLFN